MPTVTRAIRSSQPLRFAMNPERRFTTCVLALCVVLIFSHGATPEAQGGVQWHADIQLSDLAHVVSRLAAREIPAGDPPLRLVRDAADKDTSQVVTCTQYLAAIASGYLPESTLDVTHELRFVRDCFLLRDLQAVRVPTVSALPVWNYGVLGLLPPILEWGEKGDPDPTPPLTWNAANPAVRGVRLTDDAIGAEDDSADYSLQRIAVGDFNGDGTADIAVIGDITAKEGSYARREYMILSFCAGAQRFVRLTEESRPFRLNGTRCR